jgi:hypothetical protein
LAAAVVAGPVAVGLGAAGPVGAVTSSGVTTSVTSAAAPMANMSSSQTPVTASCPAGSKLVGGGIDLAPGQAGAAYTNGLKINGSQPGEGSATAGTTDPAGWTALGGFGGQSDADDEVTSSALCASGVSADIEVVSASMAGTTANPAAGLGPVTVSCPAGTTLLSGGAAAVPVADGSLKPIASYPSDASGNPVGDGAVDPNGWTAVSRNSSAGGPSDGFTPTTTAFALCAQTALATVVSEASTVLTTAAGSTVQLATASCPSSDALLSGGVDIDDGNSPAGPSQFGVHLIEDDASTAGGALVISGAATSWTAAAHTGGIAATVGVHAFALCTPAGATSTATPPVTAATPQSGSATPAGPVGTGAAGKTRTSIAAGPTTAPAAGSTKPAPTATTAPAGAQSGSSGGPAVTIPAPTVADPAQQRAALGVSSKPGTGGGRTGLWVAAAIVAGLALAAVLERKRLVAAASNLGRRRPPS